MTLREAVANLIKVKGRHNTEIAYQKLVEAFDADKPEQDYRDVVIAGDLWRIEFLPNNDANVRLVKAGYTTKQEEVEQAMLEVWQDVGDPRFPHIAQPEQLITPGGGLPNDHNGVTAAQPDQEPVAWRFYDGGMWCYVDHLTDLPQNKFEPLYTAPPKILCGCGDQIMPDDGAECGTCVTARNAVKQEPLAQMKEMLEVQGRDGTWNYDPYLQGMFNGMEFMVALAEGREPVFREPPERWLHTPPQREWQGLTDEEIRKIVGVTSADSDWNVTIVNRWIRDIEQALKEKNNG